ncbi:MAG: carbon starvation protein A [Candidatus Omnitrophica bacterium]|nr:carbon starvation protein A [Candidatus Omnitrophota bacterium]MCM8802252.1 carbon starvation protein A [Candidatus Omnitrophota bacterium]
MSSLFVFLFGLILFVIAYIFYGKFLEQLWGIDESKQTPAYRKKDGVDYIPARHWLILFGHHFSSIAGAGPILGPVIAICVWGWGPALLWIVLGSIFLGGVHDFSSLILSVRNDGLTVGEITKNILGEKSKVIFSLFLWFSLILVVAVFTAVTAKTFIEEPKIVIPTFFLIIDAIIFGFLVYRKSFSIFYSTILCLFLLSIFFIIGKEIPVVIKLSPLKIWIVILLIYSFIASILPVDILLQPRDYLSSFILFSGMFFGYIGLLTTHPSVKAPFYTSFFSEKGSLWPMMFVIIACGAISGFHGLVSSGTTSKQISNERDVKKIGYGGMLTEGLLSILALLSVSAGLFWSSSIPELNYPELMKKGDWIGTFATGYGQILKKIFHPKIGKLFAIIMINSFVLTTLDTATRISRYITQELFGFSFKIKFLRNRYNATLLGIIFAGYLAFGNWQKIWPVFGASNQLVAGIILFLCSFYLFLNKRKSLSVLIPSLIMFLTTVVALTIQMISFYTKKSYLLGNISLILIILSIFIIDEGIKILLQFRKGKYNLNR